MRTYFFLLVAFFSCVSCVKQWDPPPQPLPAQLSPNITLRELRQLHFPGNTEQIIEDKVAVGIVVANDSLDNFYKTIVVQDETGGISIKIDATQLYLLFPVGQQVFIRLKGCWLGDYGGLLQLGAGSDRTDSLYPKLISIPLPLLKQVLVKGVNGQIVSPKELLVQQLNNSFQNCLVRINQVEFIASDTSRPWADAFNRQSVNHVLTACGGGSVYLRTSGFARFASLKTPRGNGTITGIYTVFGWEKQLVIRDTSDINFNGLRCSGGGIVTLFSEDFDLHRPGSILNLEGWKNVAESGGRFYYAKSTGNERYTSIESFACGEPQITSWLISPTIPLIGASGARLSFSTRAGFDNGAKLEVLVSSNYDGSNSPSRSKWTLLSAAIATGPSFNQSISWTPSGSLSLSSFKTNIRVAFRYTGSDTGVNRRTTTFHLDNIRILSN